MKRRRLHALAAVASVAALSTACGDDSDNTSAAGGSSDSAPVEASANTTAAGQQSSSTTAASPESGSTASTSDQAAPETVELAAWQTIEIVDVDGVVFTLADYDGTPVLVETFATWCVNCRAQLGDTQQAAVTLGDGAAVVALSVETDLSPADVADYADDNGFADIRFAVMSPELLAAFADAFGTTVANPPSTPKVIIDATGRAGELSTGAASPDELVADLQAAA